MACCADTIGLSMTMSFDGARPIKTMSPTSSYVAGWLPFCTIKLAIECDAPACVAFQGAALCRVYSRHCSLRDLADKVSQKFPKKLEIVDYLTTRRNILRCRASGSATEIRSTTHLSSREPRIVGKTH